MAQVLEAVPGCVFDDSQKVFHARDSRYFHFDSQTKVFYQGLRIRLRDIGPGTTADLTVDSVENVLLAVQITRLVQNPNIDAEFLAGFLVFSRRMFSMELMVSRTKGDLQMKGIASRLPAIRRVNGDEAQGFWVAVGVALLEHLCSPVVHRRELDEFINRAKEVMEGDFTIIDYLSEMRSARETIGLAWLEDRHNDLNFKRHLIALLKLFCVHYARTHPEDLVVSLFPGGADGIKAQLFRSRRIEQDVMCMSALALRVRVVIWQSNGEKIALETEGHVDKLPLIYLLLHNATFHILYSHAKLQAQGYDLSSNSRIPPQQVISSPGLLRALYHSQSQKNAVNSLEIEKKLAGESLNSHIGLNSALQKMIFGVFHALQKRELAGQFFDDEICAKTSEFIITYRQLIGEMRAKHSEMMEEYPQVSQLEAQNFSETSVRAMNICQNCDRFPGFWRFSCKHVLCRPCIAELIKVLRENFGYIVSPSGEPIDKFQCPVGGCSRKVRKEEVIVVTGEEGFKKLLGDAEEATFRRVCQLCKLEREKSSFYTLDCSCKACRVCILGRILRNGSICVCGVKISAAVVESITSFKMHCGVCGEAKGLVDNFTHAVCTEHLLCRDCLEESAKAGRCSMCYRQFSEEELGDFQVYFLRRCQLGCGRSFNRAQGVKLACRCHYCLECAGAKLKETENFDSCQICRAPLPEEARKQYYFLAFEILAKNNLIMQTVKAIGFRAPECLICLNKIGIVSGAKLDCGHSLHKSCLRDLLINYTDQVIKKPVVCPHENCHEEIAGHILEENMDSKRFTKYNTALIQLKLALRTCPKCAFVYELYGAVCNSGKISCMRDTCRYEYCSNCFSPWEAKHDAKSCRFAEIQEMIRVLESDAKGAAGKRVAQCPGCKTPYLKDENCEHVKCANAKCNIDWCFECSVDRAPILAHHNQWHRPSCRLYMKPKKKGGDVKKENCPKCKKLNRCCEPPPNLKVPRRFALDEY